MKYAYLSLISVALTLIGLQVTWWLVRYLKLERLNFQKKSIPAGFGVMLVLSSTPVYLYMLSISSERRPAAMFLAAVIGFGVVGLIDDLYGSRRAGGFRGHFGLLLKGKLSTGLMKALVGGVLALALGYVAGGHRLLPGILNGAIIALSANCLNLFDLRPGRAVSCFWLIIVAVAIGKAGRLSEWHELMPVMVPAVALTVLDRSALVMMGDAGSNVLGAVAGLVMVFELGLTAKLIILGLLVGIHVYAEKYSISGLIERNGTLRRIDCMLGKR